ncbi:MqnA/MqnD/SBP family protein [Picrophilus oshimae]|uniref:Predicted solute-binding protein n=2 Tax=Picrophilus torridus (strain ATCC 700027 / DSM 9790 / JCM 10055 / NBRC 100828 / KAW 2/3) TaxID=1122961 RepID=A0A8G2FVA3_PICTO|nr:MqnA/MqnD/SBP family protein [Picrophilus oshimae]SMD30141.1 Predicted solute-binding protein [Picrophilus oshimae DSM 9789]
MVSIRVGALADSGDLYPFIPLIKGWVKSDIDIDFEFVPTVQEVNDRIVKKELDVSVPSAALYPYIQNDYYILENAVASATDGITGMPVLSISDIDKEDIQNKNLVVHGMNTTAFTLYKLFFPRYKKLIVVHRVLDEVNELVKNDGVMVAVHELKAMYQLKKLGINVNRIISMWDLWKNASNNMPMPMGMVVISSSMGHENAMKFKEAYLKSKKYAEAHMNEVIPEDVKIMRDVQNADLDESVIKGTIGADISEYNVNLDDVKSGLKFFYNFAAEKNVLPKVSSLNFI